MSVRFSILIPTYNREEHTRQAIESLMAQTFKNFELIVIDDGSTDGTPAMLASYGNRIRVLKQANQGPEVARNYAASVAQGEYLVFLDSDDLLMPYALDTYDRVIEAMHPPLLIGSMKYFQEGTPLPKQDADGRVEVYKCRDFLAKDVSVGLSNSRIILPKALLQEIRGLRQTSPRTFHLDDFNLVLKLGTASPCAIVKHPTTVAYRTHDTNSIKGLEPMINGIFGLIRDEHAGLYPGGRERRYGRYVIIGGIAQRWVQKAYQFRQPGQALRLLFGSLPMIAAIGYKKLTAKFRKSPTELITMPAPARADEMVASAGRAPSR